MKKNILLKGLMATVAMTAAFTSCSNNELDGARNAQVDRLTLTSQVRMTRTTNQNLQATQIAKDVKVGAYITQNSAATSTGDNVELTADGNGNLSGGNMTWPTSGNVDIYAYAPYNSTASLSNAYEFTVQADQSSDANYLASDLLYANATNQAKTTDGNVALTFAHKLTKLNINIENKNSEVDLKGATVSITGTLPSTTLTLTSGALAAASGNATTIKAATFAEDAETFKSSAIIVPQTISSGSKFALISTSTKTLTAKLGSEVTFASGKSYTYNITINGNGEVESTLTLNNAQVTDWDSNTDALPGTAEESITYGVGDYILSDGTLLKANKLDDTNKSKVAAIIFSTTVSNTDAAAGYGAYAMSVKRYQNRFFTNITDYTEALGEAVTTWSAALNDLDGLTKTEKMLGSDYYTTGLSTEDDKAKFIANMSGISGLTKISSESISKWFLPSFGQIVQIMNEFGKAGITASTVENGDNISSASVIYSNENLATLVSNLNEAISKPLGNSDFIAIGNIQFATSSENGGSGNKTKYWCFETASSDSSTGTWKFGKNYGRGNNSRNVIPVVAIKLSTE